MISDIWHSVQYLCGERIELLLHGRCYTDSENLCQPFMISLVHGIAI